MGTIDFDDLQGERGYSGQTAYNQSKLASVMFTYELARRLEGTRRDGHRAAPRRGAAPASAPRIPSRIFKFLVPLMRPFMKTPRAGRRHVDLPGVVARRSRASPGTYFAKEQAADLQQGLVRRRRRGRLWQVSAGLVGHPPH